jgi:hypothetical protein
MFHTYTFFGKQKINVLKKYETLEVPNQAALKEPVDIVTC